MNKMCTSLFLYLPVILCFCISCKKESEPEEDKVVYPVTLKLMSAPPKGDPSLFSNGSAINDVYKANIFIADATEFFLHHFEPPVSVTFHSKDTISFKYVTNLGTGSVKYGVHLDGDQYWLVCEYSYPFDPNVSDTSMINVAPGSRTGEYRPVLNASGDMKVLKVAAFADKIRQYKMYNGEPQFKHEAMGGHFGGFKESYVKTLSSLDTLGIQRYDVIYK